jgi:hypothetical protein
MEDRNVKKILKNYTRHSFISLVSRGNKAILAALKIAKRKGSKILIPNQGGWLTYSQYAGKLKFDIKSLKTDYGVIELNFLKKNIKGVSALIYSNPAAYYAEQPVEEIYRICQKNSVFVVLDITGCIGSDFYHGNCADVIVCSFGEWKPVNLGYGGFISIKDVIIYRQNEVFLKNLEFDENYYVGLEKKLKSLEKRQEFFKKISHKIKKELASFDILHRDRNGINVVVKFNNLEEQNRLVDYCEKNKYEFVLCPKSIKVNENAVSIEVKRLE